MRNMTKREKKRFKKKVSENIKRRDFIDDNILVSYRDESGNKKTLTLREFFKYELPQM